MNEKAEALRLIQHMDDEYPEDWDGRAIRAELRRLHADNERLREKNERLMEALEIIAGYRQCVDPLMGNQDVAKAALRREEKK